MYKTVEENKICVCANLAKEPKAKQMQNSFTKNKIKKKKKS